MQAMKWMRGLAAALLMLASAGQAAEQVPVEAFVPQQTFDNPRISSKGTYLAVSADFGNDEHGIAVFRLSDMQTTAYIKLPKYQLANEIYWVNDTQLIYVKGGQWGSRERPYDFGEIIAMDYDGKHHKYIYGYKESTIGMGLLPGHGNVVGLPLERNGTFYMTRSGEESAIGRSLLYSIDVNTARHDLVADVGGGQNMSFVLDANGVPRFAFGADKNERQLLFVAEDADGKNWREVPGDKVGGVFVPLAFAPDGKHVFATYATDGGPLALIKSDLSLTRHEVLASDGFNDVGEIVWDSNWQPLAVEFKGALPRVQMLNPASPDAKIYKEIRAGFPGQHVRFVDHSADGNVSLLYVHSDRNPGEWALLNRKENIFARVLQRNPAIDPARMGTRHYVRFKASDGLELDAYVTVPAGVTELKNLPMVLLPHGGPHYVSDTWGFDNDAQFLASRGYLVLQVNYRGSSDRGYAFHAAGFREWGDRIQEDMIDGMRWAVSKGYADADRICVYGVSFGGYSALMLAAKAPELVKCAVGLSGLYDLRSMANKSDTSRSYYGRAYIERVVGDDDDELLANSPLSMARRIKAPVFLAHGEEDERTPFDQAEDMYDALVEAGNRPLWMPVEDEGHGFYARDNQIEFYEKLEEFLAEHIGAGSREK